MSIDNKIEESKQKAIELGIFELVQDVVQNTPYPDAEGRGVVGETHVFGYTEV